MAWKQINLARGLLQRNDATLLAMQ